MGHNHTHAHDHSSIRNIKVAFFLNFFFTIIEFIGGFLTNSIAIMSDALHDLGDSFSLGLAWFLQKYSKKKRTNKFSYGYKRFSLLGAFTNATILLIGTIFILAEAIPRIFHPETSNAHGMFLLAIFGIIVNGFAAYKTAKGKTMNEKVISLHLLEDVLGWVAIFIVSIIMIFTKISILDPILSVLITIYILVEVIKRLKETILLFLQATPKHLSIETINKKLKAVSLVKEVRYTHIWSLDGEENILTAHIIINKKSSRKNMRDIKCKLKKILREMGISHTTLELEFEDENFLGCCD